MENYKSNSDKSRAQEAKPAPEKKFTKVIQGEAKIHKSILPVNDGSILSRIFYEVILPGLKNITFDTVVNGVDLFLFGDDRVMRRRRNDGSLGRGGSYNQYYDHNRTMKAPSNRPDSSGLVATGQNGFRYEPIVLDNKGDVEVILDNMYDAIDMYGIVSVSDMYDMAGMECDNYNACYYGWKNLSGAEIRYHGSGSYILKLPRAIALN